MREAYERQAWLGIPSGVVRGEKRLLRAVDVSFVQPDAAQLAERPSELATQVGPQLFTRLERLDLGFSTRSAQAEDLGTVHATTSVQAADRVGARPALHRVGPFLRQVVLREPLQRAHELAVDDASGHRIEIS